MQCQLCDNHATVHLTEIVNGQKIEKHLCEKCAQKEGITVKTSMPLADMLDNLVHAQKASEELAELCCPQCDISWTEFRKGGLLGCPHDYVAFEAPLRSLIERAQEGAYHHVGRVPKRTKGTVGNKLKLMRLRQDLQRAVDEENYEDAVTLRDEIRKCETN